MSEVNRRTHSRGVITFHFIFDEFICMQSKGVFTTSGDEKLPITRPLKDFVISRVSINDAALSAAAESLVIMEEIGKFPVAGEICTEYFFILKCFKRECAIPAPQLLRATRRALVTWSPRNPCVKWQCPGSVIPCLTTWECRNRANCADQVGPA